MAVDGDETTLRKFVTTNQHRTASMTPMPMHWRLRSATTAQRAITHAAEMRVLRVSASCCEAVKELSSEFYLHKGDEVTIFVSALMAHCCGMCGRAPQAQAPSSAHCRHTHWHRFERADRAFSSLFNRGWECAETWMMVVSPLTDGMIHDDQPTGQATGAACARILMTGPGVPHLLETALMMTPNSTL
jgi:hypothetical protein